MGIADTASPVISLSVKISLDDFQWHRFPYIDPCVIESIVVPKNVKFLTLFDFDSNHFWRDLSTVKENLEKDLLVFPNLELDPSITVTVGASECPDVGHFANGNVSGFTFQSFKK